MDKKLYPKLDQIKEDIFEKIQLLLYVSPNFNGLLENLFNNIELWNYWLNDQCEDSKLPYLI